MPKVECTMTTCKWNNDRECIKDKIFVDVNQHDKRKPIVWCYEKREEEDL